MARPRKYQTWFAQILAKCKHKEVQKQLKAIYKMNYYKALEHLLILKDLLNDGITPTGMTERELKTIIKYGWLTVRYKKLYEKHFATQKEADPRVWTYNDEVLQKHGNVIIEDENGYRILIQDEEGNTVDWKGKF